jgi:hypothetical protein
MTAPFVSKFNTIRALRDTVLVADMSFDARTMNSGIIIPNDNGTGSGIRPRWGRVYAIGPDQKLFRENQWVLVAHGRWTRGMEVEDAVGKHTIRKVDPKDILMVSDELPQDETMSDAINIAQKKY